MFMFDRLGRRQDEPPFILQWFVEQGIEVWSVNEVQQKMDQHVDKLLNYIRFWQAQGESEKTSVQVKAAQAQMIQDGHFRGRTVSFGYSLEHRGRMSKKGHPLGDLVINEQEAAIVRIIFDRAQEIANCICRLNLMRHIQIRTPDLLNAIKAYY